MAKKKTCGSKGTKKKSCKKNCTAQKIPPTKSPEQTVTEKVFAMIGRWFS
jgi:hypothetical protein